MASVKCPKCNKELTSLPEKCPGCGFPVRTYFQKKYEKKNEDRKKEKDIKQRFTTWKLVSGILSMVLFILVAFQSCAAGLGNAILNNGESSGSGGIFVAVMMLSGGIVSVSTRNSKGNGGNIALIVLFGLGALVGFALAGSFADLYIWSAWCLINAVLAIIAMTGRK